MTLKDYFKKQLMEEQKKQSISPEQKLSEYNIKQFELHLNHLKSAIDYHMRRKPGWSDTYGYVTQNHIDRKVKDLTRIYNAYEERHLKALQNHKDGNFAENKDHFILGGDYY